jgi:hypothetical protein
VLAGVQPDSVSDFVGSDWNLDATATAMDGSLCFQYQPAESSIVLTRWVDMLNHDIGRRCTTCLKVNNERARMI